MLSSRWRSSDQSGTEEANVIKATVPTSSSMTFQPKIIPTLVPTIATATTTADIATAPTLSPTTVPRYEAFHTTDQMQAAVVEYLIDPNPPTSMIAKLYGRVIRDWDVSVIEVFDCYFAKS